MTQTILDLPIMRDLRQYGARTTHHLIRVHGPKPNWQHLIDDGYLIPRTHVEVGQTIALTDKTRQLARAHDRSAAYVNGPGNVALAAIQADFSELLASQGYAHVDTEYHPRSESFGRDNRPGAKMINSSIVLRRVLRVPDDEFKIIQNHTSSPISYPFLQLELRKHDPGPGTPARRKAMKTNGLAVPGHPSMYVLLGSDENVHNRIDSLERKHRKDRQQWQTSLIICVLDDLPHRSHIAALNARHPLITPGHARYPDLIPPTPAIKLIPHLRAGSTPTTK